MDYRRSVHTTIDGRGSRGGAPDGCVPPSRATLRASIGRRAIVGTKNLLRRRANARCSHAGHRHQPALTLVPSSRRWFKRLAGPREIIAIDLGGAIRPQADASLTIRRADGSTQRVTLTLRIDTAIEVDYYRHGGILPYVLRQLLAG